MRERESHEMREPIEYADDRDEQAMRDERDYQRGVAEGERRSAERSIYGEAMAETFAIVDETGETALPAQQADDDETGDIPVCEVCEECVEQVNADAVCAACEAEERIDRERAMHGPAESISAEHDQRDEDERIFQSEVSRELQRQARL